jgi:hypothetical protein
MATVFFGGGGSIEATADARVLIELFSAVARGEQRGMEHGRPLPIGYVAVHTDDGAIFVNVSQVAYVRELKS